jgi:hypothetical protein
MCAATRVPRALLLALASTPGKSSSSSSDGAHPKTVHLSDGSGNACSASGCDPAIDGFAKAQHASHQFSGGAQHLAVKLVDVAEVGALCAIPALG